MSNIVFLGDVSLLHENMDSEYILPDQDALVFNLEYALTDKKDSPIPDKINLCGPTVNFDKIFHKRPAAVTLANNHIMDYGARGFEDTTAYLDKCGISYFGAGHPSENCNNPAYIFIGDKKVALIGYNMVKYYEDKYIVAPFDEKNAEHDISLARKDGADSVIVNIHWGMEDAPYPAPFQEKIGHFLIDHGVDAVIGHHPHCLQPFEKYNGKYIFYSIGNCIFPDHSVEAFFDENNHARRSFKKKWLPHNRKSYAVRFDVENNNVTAVEMLRFKHNQTLKKVKLININKNFFRIPPTLNTLIRRSRAYSSFIISNTFKNGKIFDISAVTHEITMKRNHVHDS